MLPDFADEEEDEERDPALPEESDFLETPELLERFEGGEALKETGADEARLVWESPEKLPENPFSFIRVREETDFLKKEASGTVEDLVIPRRDRDSSFGAYVFIPRSGDLKLPADEAPSRKEPRLRLPEETDLPGSDGKPGDLLEG